MPGTLVAVGWFSTRLMVMRSSRVLALSFAAGSIPSSQIAARVKAGIDLRDVGSGTVSGTSLYRVAGFVPLAVSGIADIAKATVGPVLAGRDRPVLAALAGSAAIAGHNWSPFLRGAGGRGFAPSLGVLGVNAWPGVPVMLGGLVAGKAARQTGLGGFAAQCALVPVLARTHGRRGALVGACVVAPMWAKRLVGNKPPAEPNARVYAHRLLFDRDPGELEA
ncbi:MAG TPA: glycerol-3-phosphate acyltransferase [Acidimicrobiia bacterium]|nr:glycerol-3-phosphate acyltransferase [Acidimicrobiia bacterium]